MESEFEQPQRRKAAAITGSSYQDKLNELYKELLRTEGREEVIETIIYEVIIQLSFKVDLNKIRTLSKQLYDYSIQLKSLHEIISKTDAFQEAYSAMMNEIIKKGKPVLDELNSHLFDTGVYDALDFLLSRGIYLDKHFDELNLYEPERDLLKIFNASTKEGTLIHCILQQYKANGRTNIHQVLKEFASTEENTDLLGLKNDKNEESKDRISLGKKAFYSAQIFMGAGIIGVNINGAIATGGIIVLTGAAYTSMLSGGALAAGGFANLIE